VIVIKEEYDEIINGGIIGGKPKWVKMALFQL
jgi:hypothetical protein